MIRTKSYFNEQLAPGLIHACERYLDPKNQIKGSIIEASPAHLQDKLLEEVNESDEAFFCDHSPERQLEELGDVVLVALARIKQIEDEHGL